MKRTNIITKSRRGKRGTLFLAAIAAIVGVAGNGRANGLAPTSAVSLGAA